MIYIIGPGHCGRTLDGFYDNPGKQRPDGTFFEGEYNRTIVDEIKLLNETQDPNDKLNIIMPFNSIASVSIRDRVKWIKNYQKYIHSDDVCSVEIHANAGSPRAHGARFVTDVDPDNVSKTLTRFLKTQFNKLPRITFFGRENLSYQLRASRFCLKTNSKLGMLRHNFPSVIIETGFFVNDKEVKYLNSITGRNNISTAIFNSLFQHHKFWSAESGVGAAELHKALIYPLVT